MTYTEHRLGVLAREISPYVKSIVGVDISQGMVRSPILVKPLL
jgi:hypothetical protein